MLTRKPRKGDRLYEDLVQGSPQHGRKFLGTVTRFDQKTPEICYFQEPQGGENCFIWVFRDGLNTLMHVEEPSAAEKRALRRSKVI